MKNKFDAFLFFYFDFLEHLLIQKKSEISSIKFQSEEANTDEYIKSYLQGIIKQNNRLPYDTYSSLVISTDGVNDIITYDSVCNQYIKNVYLPIELTENQKKIIASGKSSVYTNPDLYFELSDGGSSMYCSVEIKTTKNNTIPGSSVQQVAPYEWTIFIKHNGNNVDIACGYYMNAITNRLPFPDRSPRPIIGFDTMQEWNKNNRYTIEKTLTYKFEQKDVSFKKQCLENWEVILCNEWIRTIQQSSSAKEKWFNNTIRMYTLDVLNQIKKNPELLDKLIEKLEKNIHYSSPK